MRKKILIIGSAGQIGGAIFDILKRNRNFKVVPADKIASRSAAFLDITNKKQVGKFFEKVKPSIIILTAALTNVDICEQDPTAAYLINVKGVRYVVEAAKKNSAKMIYISSAYVFDGKKGNYKEDSKPNPINYYGKTKLEAEKIIQNELNDYLIIRAIWVFDFGYDQKNFIVRLLDSLKKKEIVKVPNDQYSNPTLATNIAWAIKELIQKNRSGIFNIAGADKMSKYKWALEAAKCFNLNPKLIIPVLSSKLSQAAKRPKKHDLNIGKAQRELKTKMLSLNEALNFLNPKLKGLLHNEVKTIKKKNS